MRNLPGSSIRMLMRLHMVGALVALVTATDPRNSSLPGILTEPRARVDAEGPQSPQGRPLTDVRSRPRPGPPTPADYRSPVKAPEKAVSVRPDSQEASKKNSMGSSSERSKGGMEKHNRPGFMDDHKIFDVESKPVGDFLDNALFWASCLVKKNGNEILHSRRCPNDGNCSIGPYDLKTADELINVMLCSDELDTMLGLACRSSSPVQPDLTCDRDCYNEDNRCSVGPILMESFDGHQISLMFCLSGSPVRSHCPLQEMLRLQNREHVELRESADAPTERKQPYEKMTSNSDVQNRGVRLPDISAPQGPAAERGARITPGLQDQDAGRVGIPGAGRPSSERRLEAVARYGHPGEQP